MINWMLWCFGLTVGQNKQFEYVALGSLSNYFAVPWSINPFYVPPLAPRAILWRTRQEELQQLQNVPVVSTRLRRGAVRGRTSPPDPILPRRLRQPVAPIQSQHQLRGLLLHHAEAFKQGEQVHRLPWLLGVDTKRKPRTLSFVVLAVCFRGCLYVRGVHGGGPPVWWSERLRTRVNVCASVLKLHRMTRARFATCSFWLS